MRVNDFSIHVASANGTGSQSSNLAIMRGIFNMGIPVVAKNFFPSNIQGLPTWYNLRVNGDGYLARRDDYEILVCMNQVTVVDDLKKAPAGCVCFVRDKLVYPMDRDDITVIPFPADALIKEACDVGKLRKLVINFIYVGVVMEYLGIERDAIEQGLSKVFGGKPKAVGLNMKAVDAGAAWAKENLPDERTCKVERLDKNDGKFIVEGNEAAALGAMFGGCNFIAWYPITPSSSLCEAAIKHFEDHRVDEDGKRNFAVVQAEDELASLGMVLGAAWAGARAMTATSGPGISLMSEFAGLGYFSETPAVVVNVQRMGPSTGLPTRTSQGDILSTYYLSHGDARHPLLFPSTPKEAFEFGWKVFDLADRLQTPVFLMLDLDLGMNNWMSDDFDYPDQPLDRGKLLDDEGLAKMDWFGRYADVDGDGIPYRTVPGIKDPRGAWFARGTGHTPAATYSEDPRNYAEGLDRLAKKFDTARTLLPQPVVDTVEGATLGVIAYGTSDPAVAEARDRAAKKDKAFDYMRIRAVPAPLDQVRKFVEEHDAVYVIDQNRDEQMAQILRSELRDLATKIQSVTSYDGLPLSAGHVVRSIPELDGVEAD